MIFRSSQLGGGIVQGKNPWWDFEIEWDETGKIVRTELKKHPQGLGDTIANAAAKLGVKPCKGCKDRQKKLNRLLQYT